MVPMHLGGRSQAPRGLVYEHGYKNEVALKRRYQEGSWMLKFSRKEEGKKEKE